MTAKRKPSKGKKPRKAAAGITDCDRLRNTHAGEPCPWTPPVAAAVLLGLSLRAESKGDWSHVYDSLERLKQKLGDSTDAEVIEGALLTIARMADDR